MKNCPRGQLYSEIKEGDFDHKNDRKKTTYTVLRSMTGILESAPDFKVDNITICDLLIG